MTKMKPDNSYQKCKGNNCAYRKTCKRFMRPAGDHQNYAEFDKFATDDCKHWEIIPREGK